MNNKSLKTLVIGLDGATWDIASPLVRDGRMPVVGELAGSGVSATLRSIVPPVSSVAWGAFMTGMGPGGTGSIGFRRTDIKQYAFHTGGVYSSSPFTGLAFWDAAGDAGMKVAIIGVPATYPAWPVNGVMVSGFPAPAGGERCFFPEEAAEWAPGPVNLPDDFSIEYQGERALRANREMADNTLALALEAIRRTDPEIMVVVFSEIDKVQHDFMTGGPARAEGRGDDGITGYGAEIEDFYIRADSRVGRLLENIPGSCNVVIVSDHGGGPEPEKWVNLNAWLASRRLFSPKNSGIAWKLADSFKGTVRSRFSGRYFNQLKKYSSIGDKVKSAWRAVGSADWTSTRAFAVPVHIPAAAVMINLKGRQPRGIVEPGSEYEQIRTEIIDGIKELVDAETGLPVVRNAWRREEIYRGLHVEDMPDILIEYRDGYRTGMSGSAPVIAGIKRPGGEQAGGTHTMSGIFAARGPGIKCGAPVGDLNIIDVAPTVCHISGLPVPSNFEGRVMEQVLEQRFMDSRPVREGGPLSRRTDSGDPAGGDIKSMREKLAGFGYL